MDYKEISAYETPDVSPGFLLWQISMSWRGLIESSLKPIDLTHPQFVVLACIGFLTQAGEGVTQAMVGKMANLDPNTLSQVLRGLEGKGLVVRKPSTDGRVKNPFLTSKGKKKVRVAIPAVEGSDEAFFNQLTSSERKLLMKIFQKLTSEEER
ncbi:MAG: putative HTH-type transcriptional regulator [Chlamydiia bacterium]|nr:putative HTH-type transcriptional regulator [Chlamydiia bacterium]